MALEDIRVVTTPDAGQLTGNATAVLHELGAMLAALAEHGEPGVIDLGGMPLSPADRDWLATKLGRGEIDMTLDLDGSSTVRETAFHGIWWIAHHNEKGVATGEFIEVNRVPALVPAHPDDIREAAANLGLLIEDL
jgi:hydrogenase-1 operon protein HyaF